jgi:hypothetical protein
MEKQIASAAPLGSDRSLPGSAAGQAPSPDCVLASTAPVAVPAWAAMIADPALTGEVFAFEPSWPSPIAELSDGLSPPAMTSSAAAELGSLFYGSAYAQIDSAEVPIWGYAAHDLGFF